MKPEVVIAIRSRARAGEPYTSIAASLGVSRPTVSQVARGKAGGAPDIAAAAIRVERHGRSRSSEYGVWLSMWKRCTNPKARGFDRYGAIGITVCDAWRSFSTFLADMGERPSPQHSIERMDNARGYEPGNCRWATDREQRRNTRRTRTVVVDGVVMCVADAARAHGLSSFVVYSRLNLGWPVERALRTPVRRLK